MYHVDVLEVSHDRIMYLIMAMSLSPRFLTTGTCFAQIHVYYINVLEVPHDRIMFFVINVDYIVVAEVFNDRNMYS